MGKVVEKIKIINVFEPEKVVELEAVIDTGATMLVLPQNVANELGLKKIGERRVKYANNQIQLKPVYRGVILELKGRDGIFDVLGEAEGSEPLVGQIVLEALDLIVDPITKTVIPNPRSPDMPMVEILFATSPNSGCAVRYCSPKPLTGFAYLQNVRRNCRRGRKCCFENTPVQNVDTQRLPRLIRVVKEL